MPLLALKSWREWGLGLEVEPSVVGPVEGGLTNQSWLLVSGSRQLVLRINAENSLALGIDRTIEATVLAAASSAGLAPRDSYCNPEQGILVSPYLPAWQPGKLAASDLEKMAHFMRRLHQLEVNVPAVDYVTYSEGYIERLQQEQGGLTAEQSALRDRELPFVELFQSQLETPRLCHHDPSPSHWRIDDGKLCLIDWEYAALRDPACDLALLVDSWQLSREQTQQLLTRYGGEVSVSRLEKAQRVCRYIDQLWFALQTAYQNT